MDAKTKEREALLCQSAEKILLEIWKDRVPLIEQDYKMKGEAYEQEFCERMERLLQQWAKLYQTETKELKYVIVTPLGSGVITKSYEIQVALFGKELYLDENPMCFYWTPHFLYKDVEKDMERYKKEACKEIVRLMDGEVDEIRRRYVLCHAYAAMHFMDKVMKKVVKLPGWEAVGREDTRILYGTYMEQMVEITKEEEGRI